MKAVLQRVKQAKVQVAGNTTGEIGKGILVFLGVGKSDTEKDLDYLVEKISGLRIFEDEAGKMNRSLAEAGGEFLVVSQFTLMGNCQKGRRPSFDDAADPAKGEEYYRLFVSRLAAKGFKVQTGEFRAMMEVFLVNDGPVTFVLDSDI
jgi:D-tyrosyl-tRNA(Tyr) deacylase